MNISLRKKHNVFLKVSTNIKRFATKFMPLS